MTFDLAFFAVAIPAVFFAAMSKAGFGSGASFVASAILAIWLPPGLALGIMLPLLMLVDVASLKPYWKKWHGPSVLWLMIGSLPGVALGAWLFTVVDADIFRLLIGVICLLFVAWQVWSRRIAGPRGEANPEITLRYKALAMVTGTAGGFTSFVSHAGGPPVAVFLLGQGFGKTTYQATTVILFWAVNIFKAVPYAFLGIFTYETLLADLMLAPVALFGTWVGVRAHYWMSERTYFLITYTLLIATGTRLIWVALSP